MPLSPLSPAATRAAMDAGARLIDIRAADEYAREHIAAATLIPLAQVRSLPSDGKPIIFYCKSGMRTATASAQLCAAAGDAPAYMIEGGLDAWRKAGEPVVIKRAQPLEIMRQVQIAAGLLILSGLLLGLFIAPAFLGLTAFVGAGLVFAGATGWCGMAHMLRRAPWNRRAAG